MLYSATCGYAIRALTHLALYGAEIDRERMRRVQEIADAEDIPRYFLGKVFQTLVQAKILRSAKGPRGGFALAKPASEITLWDIVAAVDGTTHLDRCVVGLASCSDDAPCPQHLLWRSVRDQVKGYLQRTTLYDVAQAMKGKRTLLRHRT